MNNFQFNLHQQEYDKIKNRPELSYMAVILKTEIDAERRRRKVASEKRFEKSFKSGATIGSLLNFKGVK